MVCLYLPRDSGDEAPEVDGPPAPATAHVQGRWTVLVVDDEPTMRMLAVGALTEIGCNCLEAENGPAALEVLRLQASVDLLITDVGLPGGLNGRQVADAARVRRPEMKVLFITGYAENAALNHGHIERGMELLTKPFALADLTTCAIRLLESAKS